MNAHIARWSAAVSAASLALAPAIALAQKASMPAPEQGSTPLEPFLVTWLLPVAGILSVALATVVDRSTRARYRKGPGPQSIL
jgi:hypothetical protein